MAGSFSAEMLAAEPGPAVRRFAVAWRNRQRREITPVGVLDCRAIGYRFQYLEGVTDSVEGFRPFIGFPDLNRVYESPRLWPFFDLRVMDRKRPDFPQYVRWLGRSIRDTDPERHGQRTHPGARPYPPRLGDPPATSLVARAHTIGGPYSR